MSESDLKKTASQISTKRHPILSRNIPRNSDSHSALPLLGLLSGRTGWRTA